MGDDNKMPRGANGGQGAVMAGRKEPLDSLDFFPTPPWATRALIEHVLGASESLRASAVWEPACGEGHMARPLAEYFSNVRASDVHDYGFGLVEDFLFPVVAAPTPEWVITNPPFRLASAFIRRGLDVAKRGVAMLVRTTFLEGGDRYRTLFLPTPPAIVAQFVERVPMTKGRLDPKASTATSYAWLVWFPQWDGAPTRMVWIPPCRKRLERTGDYGQVASSRQNKMGYYND